MQEWARQPGLLVALPLPGAGRERGGEVALNQLSRCGRPRSPHLCLRLAAEEPCVLGPGAVRDGERPGVLQGGCGGSFPLGARGACGLTVFEDLGQPGVETGGAAGAGEGVSSGQELEEAWPFLWPRLLGSVRGGFSLEARAWGGGREVSLHPRA